MSDEGNLPKEESPWPRRLQMAEGCMIVHCDDVELLEALLVDSGCQQQLHLQLQTLDASLSL